MNDETVDREEFHLFIKRLHRQIAECLGDAVVDDFWPTLYYRDVETRWDRCDDRIKWYFQSITDKDHWVSLDLNVELSVSVSMKEPAATHAEAIKYLHLFVADFDKFEDRIEEIDARYEEQT